MKIVTADDLRIAFLQASTYEQEIYGVLEDSSEYQTNLFNEFFKEIIQFISDCLDSTQKVLQKVKDKSVEVSLVNNDQLDLFCNAEFWRAYKEVREGKNLQTGTVNDLKKRIGL